MADGVMVVVADGVGECRCCMLLVNGGSGDQ